MKHSADLRWKSMVFLLTARWIHMHGSLKQYGPDKPIGAEQWESIWYICLQRQFHIETAWWQPFEKEYHESCRLNSYNAHLYIFDECVELWFLIGNLYNSFGWIAQDWARKRHTERHRLNDYGKTTTNERTINKSVNSKLANQNWIFLWSLEKQTCCTY